MSNTFWAVFLGSLLSMSAFHLVAELIDEWKHKQHHKRLDELGQFLEDLEYDNDEE